MALQRVGGICYLKVDGTQYALRGSLKVQPLSQKREMVVGQDGVHGVKVTPIVPYIEGEFTDLGGLSLVSLGDIEGATVTAELANGKVYALRDAGWVGEHPIDTAEGKLPFRFEGVECLEQTA